jgi:hypothetical protein
VTKAPLGSHSKPPNVKKPAQRTPRLSMSGSLIKFPVECKHSGVFGEFAELRPATSTNSNQLLSCTDRRTKVYGR